MFEQIIAILWLKIRLFKNQNRLLRKVSISISLIVIMFTLLGAVFAGLLGYFLGSLSLHLIDYPGAFTILLIVDFIIFVFVVYRFSTFASEIQHSNIVDMKKMLYLPLVSLRSVYFLNFSLTLFAPVFVIFHVALLGFLAGLSEVFGPRMFLGILLVFAFYLMISSWLHYFQGALANLMENKKRKRLISVLASLFIVLLIQIPNLMNMAMKYLHSKNLIEKPSTHYVQQVLLIGNSLLPLGWLASGLKSLAEEEFWLFSFCLAGMGLVAYAGIHAGYKTTIRYYLGSGGKPKGKKIVPKASKQKAMLSFLNRQVPFVSEDTGSLALVELLNYFRHPKIRSQLLLLSMFGVFLCAMQRNNPLGSELSLAVFFLFQVSMVGGYLLSCFGTDVESFRGLLLLPTDRGKILLAKNLSMLPFSIAVHILPALVYLFWGRMTVPLALIWLMSILQMHIWICIVGNCFSIFFPYRINMNMMKQTSRGGRSFFSGVLSLFSLPFLFIPVAVSLSIDPAIEHVFGYKGVIMGPTVAAIFLAISFSIYRHFLPKQAVALGRKETSILAQLLGDKE